METISTTDLNRMLRVNVSNEFLLGHLDLKPVEVVKGNPRWSMKQRVEICEKLAAHFTREANNFKIMNSKPAKPGSKTPPKPVYDDDDDDL